MAGRVKAEPNRDVNDGEWRTTRSRRGEGSSSIPSPSPPQQEKASTQRPERQVPNQSQEKGEDSEQDIASRRSIRSRLLAVKNRINETKDDLTRPGSDHFNAIFNEIQQMHQQVHKPREQVADAEALLDITNSLVTTVRAHKNEGLTPADFINCLLKDFGNQDMAGSSSQGARFSILWKELGLAVSHIFKQGPGCCTMLGPMDVEVKQRRVQVRRRNVRPTVKARPEELEDNKEERTDTDKNMAVMFDVLKKNRKSQLENLILNRKSFAQTVENLFALSFLVKDGRAEVTLTEDGHHIVSPKNAPAANAVSSGQVSYSHFVFRFDFRDWKLMLDTVNEGEELMPHRNHANVPGSSPSSQRPGSSSQRPRSSSHEENTTTTTTPIKKLCRNRGFVQQEQQLLVEDSPECTDGDDSQTTTTIRKRLRKF